MRPLLEGGEVRPPLRASAAGLTQLRDKESGVTVLGPVEGMAAVPLRLRSGMDWSMEDAANEWLFGGGPHPGILSPDQLTMRQGREVPNRLGIADAALRTGIFKRAHNELAGQRPGNNHKNDDS